MKEKILIIGSNGLLGQKVIEIFCRTYSVVAAGLESLPFSDFDCSYFQLDITNRKDVEKVLKKVNPDLVFNAAAYTQVDRAEIDRELCYSVNVAGVKNLTEVCSKGQIKYVHISTDYVFDGKKGNYSETDQPNPLGYYGRSKLDGEKVVQDSGCRFIIARTAVLFGHGHNIQMNFANWVLRELRADKKIRVVDDQIGNPTIVDNLAGALAEMLDKNIDGLFHVAGCEPVSRYQFASEIAAKFGFNQENILQIQSVDFPQQAPRPLDVSLNVSNVCSELGVKLYNIDESLQKLKQILEVHLSVAK